jgi:hypothetical protein
MKKERIKKKLFEQLEDVPIISIACSRVGISRNSVYRWMKEDEEFKKQLNYYLDFGRRSVNDLAESVIIKKINNGDIDCSKFWLKNKHQDYIRPIIVNSLKNSVMSFKDQVREADKELEQWEKEWMKDIEEDITPKKKNI